jgi:hypothetical protein
MHRNYGAAFALLMLIMLVSYAGWLSVAQTPHNRAPAEAGSQSAADANPIPRDFVRENFTLRTRESADIANDSEFWIFSGLKLKITDALLVVFNALLFAATFALWWATQKLVHSADQTAQRQLRAYVGAHQVGIMGLEDAEPIGIGFAFINHGQTLATKFNMMGNVDLLPYPLPDEFVLPAAIQRPKQDGVIFPNEANPMVGWVWERPKNRMNIEAKKELLSRDAKQEIYAHGSVTYEDIFHIKRKTEFCFVLNPTSIVRDVEGNIVRDNQGRMQYQWGPVAGRNRLE